MPIGKVMQYSMLFLGYNIFISVELTLICFQDFKWGEAPPPIYTPALDRKIGKLRVTLTQVSFRAEC